MLAEERHHDLLIEKRVLLAESVPLVQSVHVPDVEASFSDEAQDLLRLGDR
jgi:hypothetical protein